MGEDDNSVLEPQLRVHAVEASVMTKIASADTVAAPELTAEKIDAMIRTN